MLTWKSLKLGSELWQRVGLSVSTLRAWPPCSLSAISREKAVELLRKCLEEVSSFHGILKGMFVSLLANIVSLPQLHFFWSLPESIISTNHRWSSYQGYSLMHNKLIFFLSWVTVSSMSILQSNYFYFWFFQTGNSQILAWVRIIWGTCFFKKLGTFTLFTSP